MGATLIFFSCSKDEPSGPESMPNDQNTLKSAVTKVDYQGIETYVSTQDAGETTVLPNGKTLIVGSIVTWLDVTDAWQATGLTLWTFDVLWDGEPYKSTGKYWGKGEMSVRTVTGSMGNWDIGDEELGTWDISFHGPIVFDEDGRLKFTAYSIGIGKSGKVKGMVFHSVYVLYLDEFYYHINGFYIEKHYGHRWHGGHGWHGGHR